MAPSLDLHPLPGKGVLDVHTLYQPWCPLGHVVSQLVLAVNLAAVEPRVRALTDGAPLVLQGDGSRARYTLLEAPLSSGDLLEVRGPDSVWLRGRFTWSGRRGHNPSLAVPPDSTGAGALKVVLEPGLSLCRAVKLGR